MNASGVVFALLTTLSWAFCIFPFTQAARRMGSNALNHFRLLVACLIMLVLSWITAPQLFYQLLSPSLVEAWLWLGLSGIIGLSIGDYFAFRMYSILGPRLGSVLTTFAPAAALIAGIYLSGESLSLVGIIGMLITIAGVIWLSLSKNERDSIPDHGHGSVAMGIVLGILSAICQGAGLVMARKGIQAGVSAQGTLPAFHATLMRLSTATAALFILSILSGKLKEVMRPVLTNQNKGISYALAGTVFGPTLGVSLSLATVSYLNASVAQTIFSLVPVVALFISYLLYREPIKARSLAGVLIAVTGVIVLVWHEQIGFFIFGH